MNQTIVAIDPGKNGGIAWQSPDEKACCVKMPETEGDLITLIRERACVHNTGQVVFHVENMVKHMGAGIPASAMAVYARNFGFLCGCIQMTGCVLRLVTPQEWMKSLGMGKKRDYEGREWKNHLKSEAQRRYPHLNITLCTADALLILSHATETKNPETK